MLHSSSDAFQSPSTQPHHTQQRSSQMPRSQQYNAQAAGAGYRGTSAPIAPYAFSSTPQLRQESRSSPATAPHQQPLSPQTQAVNSTRLGHPTHPSSSSDSTVSTSGSSNRSLVAPSFTARDDGDFRKSVIDSLPGSITLSTSVPDLSLSIQDAPVKPSPGRYRRAASRTDSSNSGTVSSSTPTPTQQSPLVGATTPPTLTRPNHGLQLNTTDLLPSARPGHNRASSVDDMQLPRGGTIDQAKRYRRRSLSGLDATAMAASTAPLSATVTAPVTASKRSTQDSRPASSSSRHDRRPGSSQSHERQGSSGSTTSSHASNRPSSRHESVPSRNVVGTASVSASKAPEPNRRIAPSPLSQPISPSEPASTPQRLPEPSSVSPAVKQLTALNDKEGAKGMKSRLRRAFSFGSAAELRRASAENNLSAERARLRKDRMQSDEDAEQAAIVAKQEAAGIGASIYNGQGGFTGSTDNLSISSTASSASIMLRKMGHGMKKGGRSIKGLFRPKSVIGVPAADGPITQPSIGQVSLVTVEAERQKVNVNANPHDQTGGGTGYPRLERNSIDAGRSTDTNSMGTPSNESLSRKSIIGGDRERAEVLSSMKKGILKRTDTNSETGSPVTRPADARLHDSPKSSAPSTPVNEKSDYFTRPPRLANPSTRSLPNTPSGSRGNISFSPRIQFYDAWSASDYDRRGDIATCNRLTPMLAQQIKEELNSFKMVRH
ncbi:bud neck involved protein [Kalmusia sp. IMI 367209]|nr:bud neck involved protein [Kalmusia sp. IMI 367209]